LTFLFILDDPFDYLFTQEKSNTEFKEEPIQSISESAKKTNIINTEEIIPIESKLGMYNKDGYKYDYGYTIVLNYPNEDGMMDTYLNGKKNYHNDKILFYFILETLNEIDKPREDPSDWFNFGFNEEKWMKYLNKSILMHYERNLIQQQINQENMKAAQSANPPHPSYPNMMMPMRPMMPGGVMPGYPQGYPYPMYRWPYPGMAPGMMYPGGVNPNQNVNLSQTEESKK
jgi:hypothetical protein